MPISWRGSESLALAIPAIARLRSLSNSACSIFGRCSASAIRLSIRPVSRDRNCALALIDSPELEKPRLPPAPSTAWAKASASRCPAPCESMSESRLAVPSLPLASANEPPRTRTEAATSGTSLFGTSNRVAPLSSVVLV